MHPSNFHFGMLSFAPVFHRLISSAPRAPLVRGPSRNAPAELRPRLGSSVHWEIHVFPGDIFNAAPLATKFGYNLEVCYDML